MADAVPVGFIFHRLDKGLTRLESNHCSTLRKSGKHNYGRSGNWRKNLL